MQGSGGYSDKIFVERLWQEVWEAIGGLGKFRRFYNEKRIHTFLDD
jgi:hypothetical protein